MKSLLLGLRVFLGLSRKIWLFASASPDISQIFPRTQECGSERGGVVASSGFVVRLGAGRVIRAGNQAVSGGGFFALGRSTRWLG